MNNFKSKSGVVLEEMSDTCMNQSLDMPRDEMVVSDTPHVTTHEIPSTIILGHSGRIIKGSDKFKFVGEAYKAMPKGNEFDARTYEETVNDVDTFRLIKAMESELESICLIE